MGIVDRLKAIGPGALVAAAFVGPGTVTTASVIGAEYAYVRLDDRLLDSGDDGSPGNERAPRTDLA